LLQFWSCIFASNVWWEKGTELIKQERHRKCLFVNKEIISYATQSQQLVEEQTLHDAAKILRSSLQWLEMSNEYYPLPSEVSITESCKFIPRWWNWSARPMLKGVNCFLCNEITHSAIEIHFHKISFEIPSLLFSW
jgi:hypothetical protein